MVHADGAGTKSILAYFHFKETGDASVFRGIAQDALIMNIDDLICSGTMGPFVMSNTIGRNAKLIPGAVIAEIIAGYQDCIRLLDDHGIHVESCGGETADLGDTVRTLVVDSTVAVRALRRDVITCEKIRPGLRIVGLYAGGKANYESEENSGLGSNGYTALRHELLSSYYRQKYPEAYAPEITALAYTGSFRMEDRMPGSRMSIGQALLSPTRTYAPALKPILERYREGIAGIFNNTGGGQTKCLRFGTDITYVKDNLFTFPPIFQLMAERSSMPRRELYRTLNMGNRMDIVCEESVAAGIIEIATEVGIQAQVIGRTEKGVGQNRLLLSDSQGDYEYTLS